MKRDFTASVINEKWLADYIENFHSSTRRHSALDKLTPTEYETKNTNLLQLA